MADETPDHRATKLAFAKIEPQIVLQQALAAVERHGPRGHLQHLDDTAARGEDELASSVSSYMSKSSFECQPVAFLAGDGPLFIRDRSKYAAARDLESVDVRSALHRVIDRVGPPSFNPNGMQAFFDGVARESRLNELTDLDLTSLGYRWDHPNRQWVMPTSVRVARRATRLTILIASALIVLGVFLVPTGNAAAARVAYVAAAVSVLSVGVPPLWRWARRR